MTNLYTVISDLLFQHEAVTLPGLGRFCCQSEGAKVNVITNQFERPTVTVTFDPESKDSDDLVVEYLCEREQMPKTQAENELEAFLAQVNLRLQEGDKVTFPELGVLSLNVDGTLSFVQGDDFQDHGDAFGLGDFTPTPVFTSEPQDDWKQRIADQQRDKNTKMTVDKDVMYVEDERELAELRRRKRRRARRAILFSMLALLVVLACLAYLKVIDLEFLKQYFQPQPEPPVVEKVEIHPSPELLSQMVSYYPAPTPPEETNEAQPSSEETGQESLGTEPEFSENASEITENQKDTTKVVGTPPAPEKTLADGWDENYAPPTTAKYFIIGGFFSEKQNALNHARSLFDQGFPYAFIYPTGSKYYTCYGHYETKEEAKLALAEINADVNPKAWLYERKR